MTDIVERLKEAAREIETDGTPSQVGLTATEAREAAAEIERLRARLVELADDFERRADACHDLNKSDKEQRDRIRLHGKEAAYRHAMVLARAAQMDGEG